MTTNWTPAVLNKMKALLTKGYSTAEIGKKIGVSKNAVVGKLNRLGWNAKSQEAPAKKTAPQKVVKTAKKPQPQKAHAKVAPASKKVAPKPAKIIKPAVLPKTSPKNSNARKQIIQHALDLVALKPDQCRWPMGDPDSDDFHFCSKKVFVGKPYCYEHCLQSYQFQAPKKKNLG